MTLTVRLNFFFLSSLAVVLIGFSATLYMLAREHLHHQADDRLEAAINVLSAAVEMTPNGVEWEPSGRRISFAPRATEESVIWLVTDPEGHVVDRAGPVSVLDNATEAAKQLQTAKQSEKHVSWEGKQWLLGQVWIDFPGQMIRVPVSNEKERTYQSLRISAGLSLEPIRTTLRDLAIALTGLSALVWFAAMIAGRMMCRWALRPVTRMASAAHEMDASQLEKRLPRTHSGDELESLGQAFNELLDRVQEAFVRQQRFAGAASHQLRTPLTALLGEVEVALRRERSNEEYRRVLGSVHQQAERLRQIVESLLFLSRADAEAQLPQRERMDLALWLPKHLQTWHDHPRARDIVTQIDPTWANVHIVLALHNKRRKIETWIGSDKLGTYQFCPAPTESDLLCKAT